MSLGANIKTIGQRLSDHGAHTAYIGKWHLDGTDYFGSGRCADGWDSAYWFDMRRYLEGMSDEDRVLSRVANTPEQVHKHGITESFTFAHQCSDRAVSFLTDHHEEDFLLVVSYDEPHGPCVCPPPYCDMFVEFEYSLGPNAPGPLADKPPHIREWAEAANVPTDRTGIRRPMYFGCNSFVDHEIGRVVDAVSHYTPEALVIYTSDHGTPLLSHGLPSKGPAMFEETTRIPFIVRWPGRTPPGSVCAHPATHMDVVPTVLDAFGLESPPFLEGQSMLAAFADPARRTNEVVFMEFNRYEVDHDSWGGFQPIRCALDGRFKLVINLLSTDELYDLETDPYEMSNLIGSQDHADVRDRLHTAILDWMGRTRDPFRGPCWERRPWQTRRTLSWNGPMRLRPDDGYEKRMLDYATGLDAPELVIDLDL
jgi:uncharacterized sulfatase